MRCRSLFLAPLLFLASSLALADYRIGVSIAKVDDNFMAYIRSGLQDAARQDNIQFQFVDAQGDVVRQLNQVQDFLSQQVDAVIVLPADTGGMGNRPDTGRPGGRTLHCGGRPLSGKYRYGLLVRREYAQSWTVHC